MNKTTLLFIITLFVINQHIGFASGNVLPESNDDGKDTTIDDEEHSTTTDKPRKIGKSVWSDAQAIISAGAAAASDKLVEVIQSTKLVTKPPIVPNQVETNNNNTEVTEPSIIPEEPKQN